HPVDPSPDRVISRHDGSKDDIEAIGNRKIGKSRLGNWYSEEEEFALGRGYSQAILRTVKLIDDPQITEYVNRVGQTIVHNSDAKVAFKIKVIDDDEINAFALPGGFLYVNSGLILAAQDEAEMAAAMAHEIAHVAARHATRQMTRSEMFQLALIPLIMFGGGLGVAAQQTADFTSPIALAKFSRGFESEADYLGVQYLYKSGYDPHAFITFFERIQVEEIRKPGFFSKAFADHPQTSSRLRKTQLEITKLFPL